MKVQRSTNVMIVKKFDKFWQRYRYKVIDVESDKHGENLLQCVINFVTKNI